MNASRRLDRIERDARTRLLRLRVRTRRANDRRVLVSDRRQQLGLVCIELVDLWNGFSRALLISSVFGTRTRSGVSVRSSAPPLTWDDALSTFAAVLYPNRPPPPQGKVWTRREEPAWHDPSVLKRAFSTLKCSNEPTLNAALSIGTRAFLDAPAFRNFFAHRNAETRAAAENAAAASSIPPTAHPADLLMAVPAARNTPLLLDWMDDMDAVMELLCE